MRKINHLIMDCETFDQDSSSCAVIDFSIAVYSTEKMISDKPYNCRDIEHVKRFKLSVKDQVQNYGATISDSTLDFWSNLGPEAAKYIKATPDDLLLKDFAFEFINTLKTFDKIDYWWSRSNTFDPVIIARIMRATGQYEMFNKLLPYWSVRDTRTYIDAHLNFPKENGFTPVSDSAFWNKIFVKHDSRWDVLADGLRLQAIERVNNDLEQIAR